MRQDRREGSNKKNTLHLWITCFSMFSNMDVIVLVQVMGTRGVSSPQKTSVLWIHRWTLTCHTLVTRRIRWTILPAAHRRA